MKTLLVFLAVAAASSQAFQLFGMEITMPKISELAKLDGPGLLTLYKAAFPNSAFNVSTASAIANLQSHIQNILNSPKGFEEGLTHLSILSKEMFRQQYLTVSPSAEALNRPAAPAAAAPARKRRAVATSVDWRSSGYVTPVKDQGSCGSCWTFSATGAMEGAFFKKTGKLTSMSEQNLLDCVKSNSTTGCCSGCNGGWMTDAFAWVAKNGIDTAASYAYVAKQAATCGFNATNSVGKTTTYNYTASEDEVDLMNTIARVGPVSTAMDASTLQNYKSGVMTCPNFTGLNHGVLIVGYGTDATTKTPFWLLKNSWGTSWGESGYFRIIRGKGKSLNCGVANAASYPIL